MESAVWGMTAGLCVHVGESGGIVMDGGEWQARSGCYCHRMVLKDKNVMCEEAVQRVLRQLTACLRCPDLRLPWSSWRI